MRRIVEPRRLRLAEVPARSRASLPNLQVAHGVFRPGPRADRQRGREPPATPLPAARADRATAAWARSSAPRTPTSTGSSRSRCSPTASRTTTRSGSASPARRWPRPDCRTLPSTVTIFDVGEHEGRPYIVMEYLAGGSLADRLAAEGAQPLGRSLEWLGEAAAALDAAHAGGIVHRDVKPANLLLDDEGRVHVADFGVASAAHLGSMTETGTVVGTAGYLAPEQARGERATAASDRYALAVVAFELLTGARPFERESTTAEALAHVSAPIPPASQLSPELPPRGRRGARPRPGQGSRAPVRLGSRARRTPARGAQRGGRGDADRRHPRPLLERGAPRRLSLLAAGGAAPRGRHPRCGAARGRGRRDEPATPTVTARRSKETVCR